MRSPTDADPINSRCLVFLRYFYILLPNMKSKDSILTLFPTMAQECVYILFVNMMWLFYHQHTSNLMFRMFLKYKLIEQWYLYRYNYRSVYLHKCNDIIDRYHMRIILVHDDAIKWKHFQRYWPFVRGIHRSPVNSPHKCQWRGALMSSLICAWISGWVNNGEAGDLRRHRAHYNVTVMHRK